MEKGREPLLLSGKTKQSQTVKIPGNNRKVILELLKNSSDVIFILDNKGIFKFVNKSFCGLLGYSSKELFDKSVSYFSESIIQNEQGFNNLLNPLIWKGSIALKSKAGNLLNLAVRSIPLKDNNGAVRSHLCITQKTKHRKSSTAITGKPKTKEVPGSAHDLIFIIDEDGNIVKNIGIGTKDVFCPFDLSAGKNIADVFPMEASYKMFMATYDVFEKKNAATINFAVFVDDMEILFRAELQQFSESQLIMTVRNITDAKPSDPKFRLIWNNSIEGMCLINKSGNITAANKSFCRIFDIALEEILLKPFYTVFDSGKIDREEVISRFQKRFFVKNLNKHFSLKLTLKTGRVIDLDIIQTYFENNNDPFILNVFRDVTKKKEVERTLQKNREIQEVGRLTAFIAHELKSPLACLKMNIDLLKRKSLNEKKMELVLNIIEKEAGRLSDILSEILDFNRPVKLHLAELSPYVLIENIQLLFSPELQKRRILLINEIDKSLVIQADLQKFQTILVHIIENSIEAIKEDGKIEISSEHINNSGKVSIFIKDNGCGIKNYEKIFEPFYTTKSSGVGLGLPIVKKMAELHAGGIRLVSGTPGNTVFEIFLTHRSKNDGFDPRY